MKGRTTSKSSRRIRRATRPGCSAVRSSKRSEAAPGSGHGTHHALRREARTARDRLRALAAVVGATGRESDARRIVELAMTQVGRLTRVREWVLLVSAQGDDTLVVEQACGHGLSALKG